MVNSQRCRTLVLISGQNLILINLPRVASDSEGMDLRADLRSALKSHVEPVGQTGAVTEESRDPADVYEEDATATRCGRSSRLAVTGAVPRNQAGRGGRRAGERPFPGSLLLWSS